MSEPTDIHPDDRIGITHAVRIGGMKGYLTANYGDEGELYELFVHGFGKLGSVVQSWTDCFCIMLSLGLQNGLDLTEVAPRLAQMKFEPNGETDNKKIPFCYSVPDYVVRWLVHHYGDARLKKELADVHSAMERARTSP